MRLCSSLASGVAAAVVALASGAVGTPAVADSGAHQGPGCAPADSADFPVDTRIHAGPAAYRAGGGHRSWTIDLTNTTGDTCDDVHPVLVLVDGKRTLRARQIRLEFHDGTRWRPVAFEKTDRDEKIGVFGEGSDGTDANGGSGDFEGFTVGPGRTVTVKARLAFTADARPDHVVASAALVQRRGDDGDWVGESNDYPFDIVTGGSSRLPSATNQLAETGPDALLGLGATAGALLFVGGALVVGSRRIRATGR
ncbi:hypothetical protein [Streptomyces kanamyceticus]|uniref:LPXTG cell wall anchor domain-containing protein n=1 Tax=Streptomyces kanamyceticus TaxID=1967 RepID=A0A5J6GJ77_STRKN|nr:hypothetical protein [Streptomyces kanamyceticus]QEU94151.1 hypothetical protein CP970_27505 [Streptomyces kanamyceticus]